MPMRQHTASSFQATWLGVVCIASGVLPLQAFLSPPSAADTKYGPRSTITCPANAVVIKPGASIQGAVDSNPATATFCIKAGVHPIRAAITPKSGNTFIGEYGAVLDGTGWSTREREQGAFRAHNEDIDDVTIRNLVIRNMPQRGIHAYQWMSDRWVIEYNEISHSPYCVSVGNSFTVRGNWLHDCAGDPASSVTADHGGAYVGYKSNNALFDSNEIGPNNGTEQKLALTRGTVFRSNYVHGNHGSGLWLDGDNLDSLYEGNRVEDNEGEGIFHEVSGNTIIRNNVIRGNGVSGVFISTSRDVQIYDNTLQDNGRGINLFVSCKVVGPPGHSYPGDIGFDLRNVRVSNNTIRVPRGRSSVYGGGLNSTGCTADQLRLYVSGSKNLVFSGNRYIVPTLNGSWWFSPDAYRTWAEWRALGYDAAGTVAIP
jgi:parallel beta-helix repeat protein